MTPPRQPAPEPSGASPDPSEDGPLAPPPQLPPQKWLRADDTVAILAHGKWGLWSAKTGVQVLRFSRAQVVGVIDPDRVGQDAARLVDLPDKGPVRIFESMDALLAELPHPPTRVVIGVAPIGGGLPAALRRDVERAIENRIPVIAGMHAFLGDDPQLDRLARRHRTPLVDLRRPPGDHVVTTGAGRQVPVPVITTVGTDCNSGKMTTAVALRDAARERGLRAAFVATGQTGLLLEPDAGAPIDRVISDFAAGEMERQVLKAAHLDRNAQRTDETPDLILVEGQGALSHPVYSGVSAAILHGSWPSCLVLCHPLGRSEKYYYTQGEPFPLLHAMEEIQLLESFMDPVWPTRVAAIALNAPDLEPDVYEQERRRLVAETGRPATDVVRDGGHPLLDAVLKHLEKQPDRPTPKKPASSAPEGP